MAPDKNKLRKNKKKGQNNVKIKSFFFPQVAEAMAFVE